MKWAVAKYDTCTTSEKWIESVEINVAMFMKFGKPFGWVLSLEILYINIAILGEYDWQPQFTLLELRCFSVNIFYTDHLLIMKTQQLEYIVTKLNHSGQFVSVAKYWQEVLFRWHVPAGILYVGELFPSSSANQRSPAFSNTQWEDRFCVTWVGCIH